jgi:hypothetical protein
MPPVASFERYEHQLHHPPTLETRPRHTPTDVFGTFPQPLPQMGPCWNRIEAAGRALNETRADLMIRTNLGLTKTYNRVHNANEHDPDSSVRSSRLIETKPNSESAPVDHLGGHRNRIRGLLGTHSGGAIRSAPPRHSVRNLRPRRRRYRLVHRASAPDAFPAGRRSGRERTATLVAHSDGTDLRCGRMRSWPATSTVWT